MTPQKLALSQMLQAEAEFLTVNGWKTEGPATRGAPIWWTSPHNNGSYPWSEAVREQRMHCNDEFDDVGEMERVACVMANTLPKTL